MASSDSAAAAAAVAGSKRSHSGAATGERRVQPRHFHDGANSISADSDGHAADGQPPAARLYRHALESVFAFLSQSDLVMALRVSRDWLAAVGSMASLQLTVKKPAAPLRVVANSAMGRHIAALGCCDRWGLVKLDADSLHIVARRMPQLRLLACSLPLPPPDQPLTFPAQLRSLSVEINGGAPAASVNAVIVAIGRLPLLEQLTLRVPAMDPLLSLAPLAALPLLQRLSVRWSDNDEFSDAQVDQLRAMPRLQEVDVKMTTQLFRRLLRQPHDLQWQQISTPLVLDDEFAALLPQLPSLTDLLNNYVWCSRFEWLRGLPNLTAVELQYDRAANAEGCAESLVDGLKSCTHIESLALDGWEDLTAAHLAELLPRLPRLRQLSLTYLRIDSLSFLSQPPLTLQLCKLQLWYCTQLPLTELLHVHALRSLKALVLSESFDGPLDARIQSLHEPPSLLLPLLEQFDYSAPEADRSDEDE